jgi:pyruvate/2-oxoglutarate/acetoin dehydrogenase E1 component
MASRTLVEAVNDALHTEMERDADVLVLGEDVGRAGGVFRATAGLRERFGGDRCVDTPLAEAGILGTAVGLAMAGWRPVCEMQYESFSYPCLDQLICHVGRYRWRTNGAMEFPITVRMPTGGGVKAPELHEDSPEAYYVHTPGVKVAVPSRPADAKGLLAAAIRSPDPVVVFEPKVLYRSPREEVPDGEHVVPLGKARIAQAGTDVTIVAWGGMVPLALAAAAELDVGDEIFPISARTGLGVTSLIECLGGLVPESPFLFPPEEASDQREEVLLAELIREQVLRRTFQEVPHSVEVVVDDIEAPHDGLTRVRALIWVETESQKGILIGAGGRMIKAVGTAARKELERELGTHVHLDLSVRVRRGWRADEHLLDRLGIE